MNQDINNRIAALRNKFNHLTSSEFKEDFFECLEIVEKFDDIQDKEKILDVMEHFVNKRDI